MYGGSENKCRKQGGLTQSIPVRVGTVSRIFTKIRIPLIASWIFSLKDVDTQLFGVFADYIIVCSSSIEQIQCKLECWREALQDRGFKISRNKNEHLWPLRSGN